VNEELVDIIFSISRSFHDKFIKSAETDETRKIALTYTTFILSEYLRMVEDGKV